MCVQNLDDSRGLAIRITYRISLRSSSLWEPRHPLLKVVKHFDLGPAGAGVQFHSDTGLFLVGFGCPSGEGRLGLKRAPLNAGSQVHGEKDLGSVW